ncbi:MULTISPECIES: hypothetical protein [unclassified Streptomyces]|uniref:hypothetical protein n=1 Tax=unclassified Streptomyces TaxID=2593676 RepID=UPI0038212DEF
MVCPLGHVPTTAQYTARAALATDGEAAHLDLVGPSSVLQATRLSCDPAGTPCADRYELRITLG